MRELNFEFMSLEEAINTLKYYKSRNCPAYGMFRDTKITTEMSEDEIYKATGVLTPKQQEAEFRKWQEEYDRELAELEDKIESGELCEREEVRKETAKEILLLLGKGFDETARKDFKDLQWYKQFCRELELRYGIELFGKTEQVENFDKLEDEEWL